MNKVYVARKYVAIEGGARHYYEEGVFSSFELAHDFILSISEEDEDYFLSEIVTYPFDKFIDGEPMEIFTYDRQGNLLVTKGHENRSGERIVVEEDGQKFIHIKHDPKSFVGKYQIGDIVFIRAYPWDEFSPTFKDTIGVISSVPVSFETWMVNGNKEYEWDNAYVVDSIRNGYLGHWHVEERSIQYFRGKIPTKLAFIKILSDFYKGKIDLAPNVMKNIMRGKIFVENVRHFEFSNEI